jgi:hypothetical protein
MTSDTSALATRRRASVRRTCSTFCIAFFVARITPAVTLVQPDAPHVVNSSPAAHASAVLQLTAHLCSPRGTCGSATATISVMPENEPR